MTLEALRRLVGADVRDLIEAQGIITQRDGDMVTIDMDDLVGLALVLIAFRRTEDEVGAALGALAALEGGEARP